MHKEFLDSFLGELVCVELIAGGVLMGELKYIPKYSAKYDFKHPEMYYIGESSFKPHHVKTIRIIEGDSHGIN